MSLSALMKQSRTAVEKTVLKSVLATEYIRNAELRFAFEHLNVLALSNVLNQMLDGPNPKQRNEADIAREKPFRLLSDKEINVYSFETGIRESFGISPTKVTPFDSLEPYARLRFFETIFPREDPGADVARLSPLQEVHKNYMKKVYEGGMSFGELESLIKQHKELRNLPSSFNVTNRMDTFTRNEAATDLLKEVYAVACKIALTMDAPKFRALRRILPQKSADATPQEIDAANLRAFAQLKFTKENDYLLGAIQHDKRMMKKLLDTLQAYQFLLGLAAVEKGGENDEYLAGLVQAFRRETDILIEKVIEHGGELHTMSERIKMKKVVNGWLGGFESFSLEVAQREQAVLNAPEEAAFDSTGHRPVSDLWSNF